jgi:xanthine dehydrogenase accessory factor
LTGGTDGDVQYYTEPLTRAGRVYVFGGGHVAQELVPVLSHIGFSVVVYEDRENFARPELFPGASDIVMNDFAGISDKVTIGADDYVVIMTRGHQMDFEVLEQTLRTHARYVGCIGSAKKLEATKRRLVDAGIAETAFERLYSPIGLKIKAETPAEIAISIAAEMIMFRASRN